MMKSFSRLRSPNSQGRGPSPSLVGQEESRGSKSPQLDTDPVSPYSPQVILTSTRPQINLYFSQDEGSQDGVGLRKEDPLNSLMSLFPAPDEAVPSTPGSSYNTNTEASSMPPAPPPAPLTPPVAEPPKDLNTLFENLKKFDWSGFGVNLGGSTGGGIPGLTEVEVKPPPELVPQVRDNRFCTPILSSNALFETPLFKSISVWYCSSSVCSTYFRHMLQ